MDYTEYASGAYTAAIVEGLTDVFHFSNGACIIPRYVYTQEQWEDIIYDNLANALPVIYDGMSSSLGGHCFVVDGYSDELFHVNWGWEGSCDGYFKLTSLNPFEGEEGFDFSNNLIANICPPASADDAPKVAVKGFECETKYVPRYDINEGFDAITVKCQIANDCGRDVTLDIGFALCDDNGIKKILSHERREISLTKGQTVEQSLIIDSSVENGNYRIVSVSRTDESAPWLFNTASNIHYIDVSINDYALQLQIMPKSDSDINEFDYGIHTIDGITYHLYSRYEEKYANVLAYKESGKYSGDLYVPDVVTYNELKFNVSGADWWIFCDSEELTSLSIPVNACVANCPRLKKLELRERVEQFFNIDSCDSLESITYPEHCNYADLPRTCKNLKKIVFKNREPFLLWGQWNCLTPESLPSLTDIYFASAVPPESSQGEALEKLIVNKEIKIHIPKGTMDLYKKSAWKDWTLVDDNGEIEYDVALGYCNRDDDSHWLMTSNRQGNDVEFAIRLPIDKLKPYKGKQIVAVEYFVDAILDHYTLADYVFITNNTADYIVKQPAQYMTEGWSKVQLDKPYTIEDEDIFVGIGRHDELSMTWATEDWEEDGFWFRMMGDVTDYGPTGEWVKALNNPYWERPLRIRAIIGAENLPVDVAVSSVEVVKVGNKQQAKIAFVNNTPRIIHNVTFNWQIDDVAKGTCEHDCALMVNYQDTARFDIPAGLPGMNHTLRVEAATVDGQLDEIPLNNFAETLFTIALSQYFPRKVVMEEATGTWCGYCPSAMAGIEKMKELYPDNLIAIAIHDDEMMPPDGSYEAFREQVDGYPSVLVNRILWGGPFGVDIDGMKNEGIAAIKLNAEWADAGRTAVKANTETTFGFSDNTVEYRIAYVLTEDHVGPYRQKNYYSNPEEEDNPDNYLNWWVHQGSTVEVTFDDVARTISNYNGIEGQLPKAVEQGKPYLASYALRIPATVQNPDNLKLVALLLDTRTGEIINADCTRIPSNDNAINNVEADCTTSRQTYNLHGQPVGKSYKGIVVSNGKKFYNK